MATRGSPEIILDNGPIMDLPDLVEAVLTAKHQTWRPNTRRAYRYDLGLFARGLPGQPLPHQLLKVSPSLLSPVFST